jgi:hypothetical protein
MYYYEGSLKPVIYNSATNALLLFDGKTWQPITNFTPSTCTNSDTNLNSCCDTLKSAFLNNDPSNQPILRAVYMDSSAPSNPVKDMLWYDTGNSLLKLYDGNNWQAVNDVSSLKTQINTLNSAFYNNDPTKSILRAVYMDSSAPSNPVADMLWFDTSNNLLKLYDGNNWQAINDTSGLKSAFYNSDPSSQPVLRAVYIDSSSPSNPVKDMLWYDTSNNILKLYDGNNWQSINDTSDLKSKIDTLNSAFISKDPSSQAILRATYVGSSAPSNPTKGTTWLDTSQSNTTIKIYDGNNWQSISGGSSSSSSSSSSNNSCKAWVNFDGTPSSPTIKASVNVSSITKNSTGDYTINFSTALSDNNYSVCFGSVMYSDNDNSVHTSIKGKSSTPLTPALKTSSSLEIAVSTTSAGAKFYDSTDVNVAIFR